MRIVVGLHELAGFGGTETYALTVAEELQRLGHDVVVHAPVLGAVAELFADHGVPVEQDASALPADCDAVLAQDAPSAYLLSERYPRSRRVLVAHSDFFAVQSPPQLPGVCDAVVVLSDRLGRYVEQLAGHPPIVRLRQPVDLKRFGVRGGGTGPARRVLILGNYLRGAAAELVTGACRDAGLEPVLHGEQSVPTADVEWAMADADIVIGLGRCVVEALAARRAAYVFGIAGGDGWVTAATYDQLEADGFAGTATPAVVDRRRLADDLAAWAPDMALVNRQLAEQHHSGVRHAVDLVAALRAVAPSSAPPPDEAAELARLVRVEWQSWRRYGSALAELRELREVRSALEAQLGTARDAARAAEHREADALARLAALRATRRYRLAVGLATPVDRLRRRLGRSAAD
jgi:hypothetical protein